MTATHGMFVWYELMTTDPHAAQSFYRRVIGWEGREAGQADHPYTILTMGDAPAAGLMSLPEEACRAGARPGWIGYVAVRDVDAGAAEVMRLGGAVHRSPSEIPGVGRFAIVSDPQGAVLALFTGAPGQDSPSMPMGSPGHGAWRELYAAELEAAFGFYSALFNWKKAEAFDMGPMGVYQLFALEGEAMGGMMTKPEAVPVPVWLYYFAVDDIDAAAERVRGAGGQIANGPHQVPGDAWILQCVDPQGAHFAMVGPRA